MPSDWQDMRLGDFIELKRGYDLPSQDRRAGAVPIVSSAGVIASHSESAVLGPGVVTGRYGTLGKTYYITDDFWPLNTTLYVRDFKGNQPKYVKYLIDSLDFREYSEKTAVPGLNRNQLHQIEVRVTRDAEIQRAVVELLDSLARLVDVSTDETAGLRHVLTNLTQRLVRGDWSVQQGKMWLSLVQPLIKALDDKIDLNRRMSGTLGAMTQALFKSWFVNFDPVRSKAAGITGGLPNRVLEYFPRSFDSETGTLPGGWAMQPVGELASVVGGTTPKTEQPENWLNGTHCWATPKDLAGLRAPVLLDTARRITDDGLSRIGSGLLPPGTVLLSSRAPIGYLAVTEVPVAINQGFIAMIPKPGISNLFLLHWARHSHDVIVSHANGSTFLEISKTNFRRLPVVTPPQSVLRAFDALAQPLHARMVACERVVGQFESERMGGPDRRPLTASAKKKRATAPQPGCQIVPRPQSRRERGRPGDMRAV